MAGGTSCMAAQSSLPTQRVKNTAHSTVRRYPASRSTASLIPQIDISLDDYVFQIAMPWRRWDLQRASSL
jgi:hypothetical protein